MWKVQQLQPHILVVTYPAQGHINPSLRLAKCLSRAAAAARITFSTALRAHRLMFPSAADQPVVDRVLDNGSLLSFIPYSDGYDAGFDHEIDDADHYLRQLRHQGSITLSSIIAGLTTRCRPVTCIIYSSFMSWVADVAASLGIPSFHYWIQPASAFAAYWHYFNDSALSDISSGTVNLPRLPPMRVRDLPSFLTITSPDDPYAKLLPHLRETFEGRPKLRVLANTSEEMEAEAMASVSDKVEIIGIGPLTGAAEEGRLLKPEEEKGYMEWLDKQEEGSVVYVSFGSMLVMRKEEVVEMGKGLRGSGRSYLWVVRRDSRWEGMMVEEEKGMVVEWCEQARVLAHRAVGCFVTHCGWNSTVEGLVCGVPTVAVPRWADQMTSAWLVEKMWGTGVRAEVGEGGVVAAEELRRCLEMVMAEGERGEEIRRRAGLWKKKAAEATREGGSSDHNLKTFVDQEIVTISLHE